MLAVVFKGSGSFDRRNSSKIKAVIQTPAIQINLRRLIVTPIIKPQQNKHFFIVGTLPRLVVSLSMVIAIPEP